MDLEIIRLMRPYDPPYFSAQEVNADSHRIICFDLNEFGFGDAIAWVRNIHQLGDEDEAIIIPCIMILTAPAPERALSTEQIEEVINAGAILYERPTNSPNVSTHSILLDLERRIRNSESPLEVEAEKRPYADLMHKPLAYGETETDEADLELFANPLAQIDDESFKRLLKRMEMRDGSWEKDD
jgi:hypothetical protein